MRNALEQLVPSKDRRTAYSHHYKMNLIAISYILYKLIRKEYCKNLV